MPARQLTAALGQAMQENLTRERDAMWIGPEEERAFLEECVAEGPAGRERWNEFREHDGAWAREAIPMPLTTEIATDVRVSLRPPNLWLVDLAGGDLTGYDLSGAFLSGANLAGACLREANLEGAHLIVTNFQGADLQGANLNRANLLDADLSGADLTDASLVGALLLRTNLTDAVLDRCEVHGVSVWGAVGDPKRQSDLTITTQNEPTITVDDIEVGQLVYLLLTNEKVRDVLETVTSKVVLILGSFSRERKPTLDRLREELRRMNLSPVLFDFDPAGNQDVTDTVTLLARLSRFVVADLTDPRSVQQELTMIAPNVVVAIQPIIQSGQTPWSMFGDLSRRSKGLLPLVRYEDVEDLVVRLAEEVVAPAEARRAQLVRDVAGGDALFAP